MKDELKEGFIHDQYGYCYYSIEKENACIYNLYTEPEYRRKGYAKKHLQYVIEKIRETGYTGNIAIEADPRENSIAVEKLASFYTDLGLYVMNTDSDAERLIKIETLEDVVKTLHPYGDKSAIWSINQQIAELKAASK